MHEARIIATLVDDPRQVTRGQMERWARDCDNWAATDACCCVLFDRTPFAIEKAHAWSRRRAEFVKRCGFVLMAGMAVHRKELPDEVFLEFLPVIRREATDGRNFVRKAVNWALRQIGKRNPRLRRAAIAEARRIRRIDSPAARWIAADALRELDREKSQTPIAKRQRRPDSPIRRAAVLFGVWHWSLGFTVAAVASCPQPAAMSRPRRWRTVLGRPCPARIS